MSTNPSAPPDPPRPRSFVLFDHSVAVDCREGLIEQGFSIAKLCEEAVPMAQEWPSQSSESSRVSDEAGSLNSREDSDEIDALLDSDSDDDDEACSPLIEFPASKTAENGYTASNSRKRKQDFNTEFPLLKAKTELPKLSSEGFSGGAGREFGGEFGGEFVGESSDECEVVQEYESSLLVDDEKKKMMKKKNCSRKVRKTLNRMRSIIPGGGKLDSLSVFDEVIKYVKMLQQEVLNLEAAKKGKVSE